MPKYRINWDTGFGPMSDEVEADTHEEALDFAYQAARDDFESQVDYSAEEVAE